MTWMVDFFFYGTLRDTDVRRVVIGSDAPAKLTAGNLLGYRCAPVEGGRFPAVQVDPDFSAPGVLAAGLSLFEAARLSYFEGEGYDYGIERCAIETVVESGSDSGGAPSVAWVFLPAPSLTAEAGVWDIDRWRALYKTAFVDAARETMAAFGDRHLERHGARWRQRLAAGLA